MASRNAGALFMVEPQTRHDVKPMQKQCQDARGVLLPSAQTRLTIGEKTTGWLHVRPSRPFVRLSRCGNRWQISALKAVEEFLLRSLRLFSKVEMMWLIGPKHGTTATAKN
jgi:hypothetical protein